MVSARALGSAWAVVTLFKADSIEKQSVLEEIALKVVSIGKASPADLAGKASPAVLVGKVQLVDSVGKA